MPFCPNKTIFVTSRLKNCSNKTGCFSTLQGHTVNFARPKLKIGLSPSSGLTNPLPRGQTDYERYIWKGATYSLPNTKHALPNME